VKSLEEHEEFVKDLFTISSEELYEKYKNSRSAQFSLESTLNIIMDKGFVNNLVSEPQRMEKEFNAYIEYDPVTNEYEVCYTDRFTISVFKSTSLTDTIRMWLRYALLFTWVDQKYE
jgi:hypothetical protein